MYSRVNHRGQSACRHLNGLDGLYDEDGESCCNDSGSDDAVVAAVDRASGSTKRTAGASAFPKIEDEASDVNGRAARGGGCVSGALLDRGSLLFISAMASS